MKRKIIPLLVICIILPLLATQVDAAIFPSVTGTVKDSSGARLQSVKVTMYYKGVKQDYDYTSSSGYYSVRINEPIFGRTKLSVSLKYEKTGYTTRTLSCLLGSSGVTKNVVLYLEAPPDTTPPTKVTGLVATVNSDSEISLTWNENPESDVRHYNIYRLDQGFNPIATHSTAIFTDSDLEPETQYTYQVSAVDNALNEGSKSDCVTATTDLDPAPRSYAILVGIGTYQYTSEFTETYGDNDANMFCDLFEMIGYTHITVLTESIATESYITNAISTTVDIIRPQDKLALVFSGHGGTDESNTQWFYTYESDASTTGLFYDYELAALLAGLDASQLFFFMRSCYSGGFASEIEDLSTSSLDVYVSTACQATGVSWNSEVENCGGWTYHFLYYAEANYESNGYVYFNDEIIGAAEAAYINEIDDNTGYTNTNNPYHTLGVITL